MTYASTALMLVGTLALAYARRRHRAEAATILIVAVPLVLSVPYNAPHWYRSLRANYRLSSSDALAVAPPVIEAQRNLPFARLALSSIAPNETYTVVSPLPEERGSAAARRERARRRYLESWLQYWLAPRIQVDRADARWWILLEAAGKPPPARARTVDRIGDDLLVLRR